MVCTNRFNSFLVSLIIPLFYRLEERGFLDEEIPEPVPFPQDSVWMLQDWLMIEFPLYEYCGMFGTDNGHIWSCSHGDYLTFGRVYLSFYIFNQNIDCLCFFFFFFESGHGKTKKKAKTMAAGKMLEILQAEPHYEFASYSVPV
jgi:hypothetical protein